MEEKKFNIKDWQEFLKKAGVFGALIALVLVYGPTNSFGFVRRILKLIAIKSADGAKRVFAWLLVNGSEAAVVLNRQLRRTADVLARLIRVSGIVLAIYFVAMTLGVALESRLLIAIFGIGVTLYFFAVTFMVEKVAMALGGVYDFGEEILRKTGRVAVAIAHRVGVGPGNESVKEKDGEKRLRDAVKGLRFLPVSVAAFSTWLWIFPSWGWYSALFGFVLAAMGLALLLYWREKESTWFWTAYQAVTTMAIIVAMLLIAGGTIFEKAFPEAKRILDGKFATDADRRLSGYLSDFWTKKPEPAKVEAKAETKNLLPLPPDDPELATPPAPKSAPSAPAQTRRASAPEPAVASDDDLLAQAAEAAMKAKAEALKGDEGPVKPSAPLAINRRDSNGSLKPAPVPRSPQPSGVRVIKVPSWVN